MGLAGLFRHHYQIVGNCVATATRGDFIGWSHARAHDPFRLSVLPMSSLKCLPSDEVEPTSNGDGYNILPFNPAPEMLHSPVLVDEERCR